MTQEDTIASNERLADVVRRAASGEDAAKGELFRELDAEVTGKVRYELRRRGFSSGDSTEEVVQRVWARVFDKLPTFDPDRGTVRTWVKSAIATPCVKRYVTDTFKDLPPEEGGRDGVEGVTVPRVRFGLVVFDRLMDLATHRDIPPQEQMAFFLVKLLGEKPREVAQEKAEDLFDGLARQIMDEYREASSLPVEQVRGYFRTFLETLARMLKDVWTPRQQRGGETKLWREQWTSIMERRTGALCLKDFYGYYAKDSCDADRVGRMWYNAARRIRSLYVKRWGDLPPFHA